MNLLIRDMQCDITFEENRVNVLIVEEPHCFSIILRDLWNQIAGRDGGLILAEGGKELNIAKVVDVIFNPFQLDINNKKVITALYKELLAAALDSVQEDTLDISSRLIEYLDNLLQRSPYPLTYDDQTGISEILKAYGVKIDDCYDNLAEFLLQYFKIMNKVVGIDLFVFVNMKQYFSNEELSELYEAMAYEKIQLLDIESVQKDILPWEKVTIIDKDRCVITI